MTNKANDITEFINAIRNLTGVGICFYDLKAFFQYNRYGVKSNRGHYCAFCEKTRSLSDGRLRCDQSDKGCAIDLANQYRAPFFYECHMGMQELVIPLMREELLLGVLFVGQCRTEMECEDTIRENAQKLNGDPEEFVALYNALPKILKKDLLSIGTILTQYFESTILSSELLSPMTAPDVGSADLGEAMRSYIQQNYRYPLSTKHIAKVFYVNASYASRCFSEKYHMTITEYIAKTRIDLSQKLLATTNAPISSISLNVGFDDVNYFARVFKKRNGCTPSQYRAQSQK